MPGPCIKGGHRASTHFGARPAGPGLTVLLLPPAVVPVVATALPLATLPLPAPTSGLTPTALLLCAPYAAAALAFAVYDGAVLVFCPYPLLPPLTGPAPNVGGVPALAPYPLLPSVVGVAWAVVALLLVWYWVGVSLVW